MLSVVLCVCETERLTQSLKEKEEIQAQRERECVANQSRPTVTSRVRRCGKLVLQTRVDLQ